MAGKKNVDVAVSPGTEAISPEFGYPADLASVPDPVGNGPAADRMAKARAARGKGRKRDSGNRPHYLVVGTRVDNSSMEIVTRFHTVGRARKWLGEMPNFIRNHYKSISLLRCKEVGC